MYEDKKLLLLMRHAKSDRGSFLGSDFDRPLNERGQNEPQVIAEQLKNMRIDVDKALVSPAKRTKETWTKLVENLNYGPKVMFEDRLYNAYYEDVVDVIKEHFLSCNRLLIVAHNPAITEVCEFLSGEAHDFKPAYLGILSPRKKEDGLDCLTKPHQFSLQQILVV